MAKKRSGTGAPSAPKGQKLIDEGLDMARDSAAGAGQWNTDAHGISQDAINYGQNNPFSQSASQYQQDILGGNPIGNNPFMQTIHGVTSGLDPSSMLSQLEHYGQTGQASGGSSGGSGSGSSGQRQNTFQTFTRPKGVKPGSKGSGSNPQPGPQGGGGAGGRVPDTVGGQNTFFAQQMRDLFDPKHLDPANDPTLQPVIDAMQREGSEDYLHNLEGLNSQLEGQGRYGGGLYQAMIGQQTEEQQEAISQAIAAQYMGAYQAQQGRRMEGLGMTNTRDISAMNDITQRYGIDSAASSARSSAAMAAREAAEGRKLQAMGMNMNAQLGLLGLAGQMGSTLQQGQSDAMATGVGYGNLGMSGYNTGINAGNLGMSALQYQGQVGQGMANMGQNQQNAANAAAAQAERDRYNRGQQELANQQDAMNDYLNILMGIGGMGGDTYTQDPGGNFAPIDVGAATASGAAGGYFSGAGAARQLGW